MKRSIAIGFFLFLMIPSKSFSQEKRLKDFFHFKNKKIESAVAPDTIQVIDDNMFTIDDSYLDSLAWEEQRVLEEEMRADIDTGQIILFYDSPVEVSEQLYIDSVWVTIREYYSIWSSNKINPYDLDGENFSDTVKLPLTYANPSLDWSMPLEQMTITSPFGLRRWKWHYGDDIRLNVGDSVHVAFDGIVRLARYDRYGYGYYILVRHYNGLETLYGHLSKQLVEPGDILKAGDVLGLGGSTGRSSGPHLHFEVRYQGNAIKPTDVFDFDNNALISPELEINASTFSYLKEARKVRYHRVRSGDTLSYISYRYGVSISTICRLNGIRRNSILRIGQRIRIT
ncbi:peptidoglycan DD-metalloendopeptidase family protein [Reichenbachiella agariperforans]|uniref:Murein DD-endopeptidase MepM and murein hydrolase activator NlpD, contain LysM domain n=1 Tax=Reichenbachiella agariperforans TaxID=156994 RepID=A0A1M6T1D2_REIAG|nr:peptidoglycan DD-metalloendopeptidase family protein [Reichenbachiella agariperforans]MBU2914803.1 peptidoglycan DD-metalloendopeptidase family protein [Reichenbachiella agariperforans]SHK50751.1 Murein DD-endopeptidase MepM and murein hydrolase activator NlpD, contain LysM domain [Reichenbachiella agariperforans]